MLRIILEDKDGNQTDKQWWLGDIHPIESPEIRNIVEIQADGDELTHINANFNNIPTTINHHVDSTTNWYGDHAKFIAANILE